MRNSGSKRAAEDAGSSDVGGRASSQSALITVRFYDVRRDYLSTRRSLPRRLSSLYNDAHADESRKRGLHIYHRHRRRRRRRWLENSGKGWGTGGRATRRASSRTALASPCPVPVPGPRTIAHTDRTRARESRLMIRAHPPRRRTYRFARRSRLEDGGAFRF